MSLQLNPDLWPLPWVTTDLSWTNFWNLERNWLAVTFKADVRTSSCWGLHGLWVCGKGSLLLPGLCPAMVRTLELLGPSPQPVLRLPSSSTGPEAGRPRRPRGERALICTLCRRTTGRLTVGHTQVSDNNYRLTAACSCHSCYISTQ